jgi:hypothetical protein
LKPKERERDGKERWRVDSKRKSRSEVWEGEMKSRFKEEVKE